MCVSAARPCLIDAEQQTSQQNVLRNLNGAGGCAARVDSAHRGIEELLKVEHGYLCCSVVRYVLLGSNGPGTPEFQWAPLFARSIARTLMRSARADCVYACARMSHASACASIIGALPGVALCTLVLI